MADFSEIASRCRSASVSRGFGERGEELRAGYRSERVTQVDLADYYANRLTLVIGEVIEAHEELRVGRRMDEVYWKDGKPEGVPVELADVVIRVMDLALEVGIDLEREVINKLDFNDTRARMHGGKQF